MIPSRNRCMLHWLSQIQCQARYYPAHFTLQVRKQVRSQNHHLRSILKNDLVRRRWPQSRRATCRSMSSQKRRTLTSREKNDGRRSKNWSTTLSDMYCHMERTGETLMCFAYRTRLIQLYLIEIELCLDASWLRRYSYEHKKIISTVCMLWNAMCNPFSFQDSLPLSIPTLVCCLCMRYGILFVRQLYLVASVAVSPAGFSMRTSRWQHSNYLYWSKVHQIWILGIAEFYFSNRL